MKLMYKQDFMINQKNQKLFLNIKKLKKNVLFKLEEFEVELKEDKYISKAIQAIEKRRDRIFLIMIKNYKIYLTFYKI